MNKIKTPKILIYDIETKPNIAYTWEKWETNVIAFKEYWGLLCFAYKWLGDKKTHANSLPQYKNEKELVQSLWNLFDEADILIAHNGVAFDTKKMNALFLRHKLSPPSPYKQIDTKLVAKRYFKFDSNKLDDLGDFLGIGRKMNTGGFDLWLGCMANKKEDWRKMIAYNKQDVILLEKIYLTMLPYIENHPTFNSINKTTTICPNCNSDKSEGRGYWKFIGHKCQKRHCQNCGHWYKGEKLLDKMIR